MLPHAAILTATSKSKGEISHGGMRENEIQLVFLSEISTY